MRKQRKGKMLSFKIKKKKMTNRQRIKRLLNQNRNKSPKEESAKKTKRSIKSQTPNKESQTNPQFNLSYRSKSNLKLIITI